MSQGQVTVMANLFFTPQGAYQKSQKTEWTGHFENEIRISQEFLLKPITAVQPV